MSSLQAVGYDAVSAHCETSALPEAIYGDCAKPLSTLMEIRQALSVGKGIDSLAQAFASVRDSSIDLTPNGSKAPHHLYTRIVYGDLYSDYIFLVQSGGRDVDYVDLINKKMGLAIGAREGLFLGLARALDFKILQLFIVCNYNFRLFNVANYLLSCLIDMQLEHDDLNATKQVYSLLLQGRLVPLSLYSEFITNRNSLERHGYNWLFSHALDRGDLLRNLLLKNVVVLAKFYVSITYATLCGVLGLEEGQIDLEALLLGMIINHQLPHGTQIDQILQTLTYGSSHQQADEGPAHRNKLITDVGELVSEICSKLQLV